jgi:hypothetical protein
MLPVSHYGYSTICIVFQLPIEKAAAKAKKQEEEDR